jgi:RHS repeat-associated protein
MSAASPSATIFSLNYDFHSANGNNGNVWGIANNKDNSRNQTFGYDALNRLAWAQNAGTDCTKALANGRSEYWGNSYGYDAWGNLLSKSVTKCSAESLSVTALANNQLSGYGYDAAGNMTYDATSGLNYSYDQENRITGANDFTYTYDGDGNRVEKSTGSTGTLYWYLTPGVVAESDLGGNLQSEYVFFAGERVARKDFPGGAVSYYFSDHLKTTNIVTNALGSIQNESDFYPWGGELQFLANDSNHYKFTGKERDAETGLDYFGARYYSNGLGRFITPDWSATPVPVPYADLTDPQTLNQYSYVRDLPTSNIDADGHGFLDWLKRGACNIGFTSACGPPQQDTKQQLINAQDAVRNNPKLGPTVRRDKDGNPVVGKNGKPMTDTHCNQATVCVAKAMGAPMEPLYGKAGPDKNGATQIRANDQAKNLAGSSSYREIEPDEAQQLADNGKLVIVAYENSDGPGHLATVRPDGVPGDKPVGSSGPLLNNVGRSVGVMRESRAFTSDADVHYYTPK